MKDSKTIKVNIIVGTVTTLATATVMTMAPMSQAQAVGLVKVSDATIGCSALATKKAGPCKPAVYRAEGGARGSVKNAEADARNRAVCPAGSYYVSGSARWGQKGRWKDWDWYYADIQFNCMPGNGLGGRKVTGL